jgi:hypothetical protein
MHIEDKDAYGRLTTEHTVLQSPDSLILRCGGCGARHNRWLDLSGAVPMAFQTTSRQNLNGLHLDELLQTSAAWVQYTLL